LTFAVSIQSFSLPDGRHRSCECVMRLSPFAVTPSLQLRFPITRRLVQARPVFSWLFLERCTSRTIRSRPFLSCSAFGADLFRRLLQPESICSLPRSEGISYVHQQSFIQNLTIRDNITFGSPLDRERYDQVVAACGLEQDLALLSAGDLTEVGGSSISLSPSP
jgi:hypothetical protein